ncbi:hypothetical protein ACP6PK_10890, partial [Dapis sp. BLCC M172]
WGVGELGSWGVGELGSWGVGDKLKYILSITKYFIYTITSGHDISRRCSFRIFTKLGQVLDLAQS